MNTHIRMEPMQTEDLPEVVRLEARLFSQPWSEKGFRDSLCSPDTLYLTVRNEGRLVGYCGLLQSLDEADITNVAVAPEDQNCGIGTMMLQKLMEEGRNRGIVRFTLEVRISNLSAIHVYEKLGFHSAGIRKRFYEMPTEDAMIMWTPEQV